MNDGTCMDCEKSGPTNDWDRCQSCEDDANERAYERSLADYYGSDSPQTETERYHAAHKEKRRLG